MIGKERGHMEGGVWNALSNSSEDADFSCNSLADAEGDVCLGEALIACSPPPQSPTGLSQCLSMQLDWEDSRTDSVPKEMEAAVSAALSSRSLTPLLKEELRCKIQLRRLQHGEEEITPDFSVKPSPMSLEEVAKKNKKMQQNRVSAQRSRERQKSLEERIKSRLELLQNENKLLSEQAHSLRHACRVARAWLQQHRSCLQHINSRFCYSGSSPPAPQLPL
ncbi:uncharacterized protein LOC143293077 isoform X2 [Babylonia areolata]|uniref:uncharacterized protein LOC143293077 isoform X2 n=1 Tax=Babylonia areolata TaxID=304850 RepID=UPI003FD54C7E